MEDPISRWHVRFTYDRLAMRVKHRAVDSVNLEVRNTTLTHAPSLHLHTIRAYFPHLATQPCDSSLTAIYISDRISRGDREFSSAADQRRVRRRAHRRQREAVARPPFHAGSQKSSSLFLTTTQTTYYILHSHSYHTSHTRTHSHSHTRIPHTHRYSRARFARFVASYAASLT